MKRNLILFFIFFSVSLSAFALDKKIEMMRGARLNEEKPPAVSIIVGANESIGSIAQAGWPIIIAATSISDGESRALPANLNVIVTDDKDQRVTVAFDPVPAGSDEAQLFWIAATQTLSPGRYHVSVEPSAGFAIESGYLTIVEANSEHDKLLRLLKIEQLLLFKKDDEALAECDRQIAADPENSNVWIAKGDILMMRDLPDEAADAYEKALALEMANDSEPLFIQRRHKDAFFRSLEKRGVLKSTTDSQP